MRKERISILLVTENPVEGEGYNEYEALLATLPTTVVAALFNIENRKQRVLATEAAMLKYAEYKSESRWLFEQLAENLEQVSLENEDLCDQTDDLRTLIKIHDLKYVYFEAEKPCFTTIFHWWDNLEI